MEQQQATSNANAHCLLKKKNVTKLNSGFFYPRKKNSSSKKLLFRLNLFATRAHNYYMGWSDHFFFLLRHITFLCYTDFKRKYMYLLVRTWWERTRRCWSLLRGRRGTLSPSPTPGGTGTTPAAAAAAAAAVAAAVMERTAAAAAALPPLTKRPRAAPCFTNLA